MPITQLDIPILGNFFCTVYNITGMPPQPLDATKAEEGRQQQSGVAEGKQQLPKGVVLGPDGKPCRSCTSVKSWMAMAKNESKNPTTVPPSAATVTPEIPSDCPPDVEALGRGTWTFLHALTANYPERPSLTQQSDTKQFISLFGKMYPCWSCADDFRRWMREEGGEPKVSNRDQFGRWMCEAHNAVNVKLGKESFDCNTWQERWRTGWKDGRCG